MRTETITRTIYTVEELQEQEPAGFRRAFDEHCAREMEWHDTSDEWGSLVAFDDLIGFKRHTYRWPSSASLGEVADLTGKRAWAWLENVVLAPNRLPWGYMSARGPLGQDRRRRAKYGSSYRPGLVEPCPFTGFYVDEVILGSLRDAFASGMSVGDAVIGLTAEVEKVCNEDADYRCTEEFFLDRCANEGLEFYATGEVA